MTNKVGRPTNYTEEIADLYCELIEMGKTTCEVCAIDGMPAESTFHLWTKKYPEFMEKYKQSQKRSATAWHQRGLGEVMKLPTGDMWEDEHGNRYDNEEVDKMEQKIK